MKIKFVLLIASLNIFSSCNYSTFYVTSESRTYGATNGNSIQIYASDGGKKYETIGIVTVDAITDEAATKLIKSTAAKLGADAVIRVKMCKWSSANARVGLSGVAIKFIE